MRLRGWLTGGGPPRHPRRTSGFDRRRSRSMMGPIGSPASRRGRSASALLAAPVRHPPTSFGPAGR